MKIVNSSSCGDVDPGLRRDDDSPGSFYLLKFVLEFVRKESYMFHSHSRASGKVDSHLKCNGLRRSHAQLNTLAPPQPCLHRIPEQSGGVDTGEGMQFGQTGGAGNVNFQQPVSNHVNTGQYNAMLFQPRG